MMQLSQQMELAAYTGMYDLPARTLQACRRDEKRGLGLSLRINKAQTKDACYSWLYNRGYRQTMTDAEVREHARNRGDYVAL